MVRAAVFAVASTLAVAAQANAAAINISHVRSIDGTYCVTGSCTQTFASASTAPGTVSLFDFDIVVTPVTMHEFSASQTTNVDSFGASGEMSAAAFTGTDPGQAPTAGSIGDSRLTFSFEVPTPHTFSFAATLLGTSSTTAPTTEASSHLFYCNQGTLVCESVFAFRDSVDDAAPSVFSTMGVLLPGFSYHFGTIVTATADAGPGFPFDSLEDASASADFTFTLTEGATSVPEPSSLLLFGLGIAAATRRWWVL